MENQQDMGRHEPAAPGASNAPSADALRSGKWRKRPVVIDAFRLGHDPMPDWFCDKRSANEITTHNVDDRWRGGPDVALIKTLEGTMRAEYGDWIIRGVQGEVYPCKPDIFAETYEPADGSQVEPSTTGAGRHIPLEPNPFIQWNGGENPALGKRVDVKFRVGECGMDGEAAGYDWGHPWSTGGDPKWDIIAYRIIPTDDSDTGKVSG